MHKFEIQQVQSQTPFKNWFHYGNILSRVVEEAAEDIKTLTVNLPDEGSAQVSAQQSMEVIQKFSIKGNSNNNSRQILTPLDQSLKIKEIREESKESEEKEE